jgi:hypothetical protein
MAAASVFPPRITEIWIFSEMICTWRAFLYRGEFPCATHSQNSSIPST